jgi:glycosyltransferase involved in cell wall biosynthesis
MKVFLSGNVLNNSYNLARFLRAKGVHAEMFLDDTIPGGQNYPWWEHSDLSPNQLPAWIHYHRVGARDLMLRTRGFGAMADAFSRCDVALVCGLGPVLAQAAGVPTAFYSFGSDLVTAHTTRELRDGLRRLAAGQRPGIRTVALGVLQRRALQQHVDAVGVLMGYQINTYLRPLGLLPKSVRLRLAWNIAEYEAKPVDDLVRRYAPYDMVFFMIARHSWRSVWNDAKGNDKFLRAFARFVRERRPNTRLICIDKGIDVAASRALIRELGIGEYIEWVPEMNKDRMRAYYGLPNAVVVDQFWHDDWGRRYPADAVRPRIGFGSGSIEALAARKPLISVFFEQDFYDGATPPILAAFREEEIHARLVEALEMGPEGRRSMGDAGHAFVTRYHDWHSTADMYVRLLEDVVRARRDGRRYVPPVPVT